MGNAFPSRLLRAPLPLLAGRFPRNAPRCQTRPGSLDLRSSSLFQISCLSWQGWPCPVPACIANPGTKARRHGPHSPSGIIFVPHRE